MKIFFYEDEEVVDIIKEECDYVVNGERTPDQCIDILNDRIGTYLAENGWITGLVTEKRDEDMPVAMRIIVIGIFLFIQKM